VVCRCVDQTSGCAQISPFCAFAAGPRLSATPRRTTPLSPASSATRRSHTRCCCMPRWLATTSTSPGGQRRGDLARRAAAAWSPARRPPLPGRVLGTWGGRNPAPRPPALAAAVAARGGL